MKKDSLGSKIKLDYFIGMKNRFKSIIYNSLKNIFIILSN